MRIKLLKKIRSHYVIMRRNNEYQLISLNGRFDDDGWTTLASCIERRREHILNEALTYKKPKSFVTFWNKTILEKS